MMGAGNPRHRSADGHAEPSPPKPSPAEMRRAGVELAREALRRIGSSRMGSVAYDSGFVARLTPLAPREEVVRRSLAYLDASQHEDGSWGSPVRNVHDRALNTLSALAGLAGGGEGLHSRSVERGLDALRGILPRLASEPQLVGSDLLIPPLVERCADLGLAVDPKGWPYRKVGRFAQALYGRVLYSGHPVGHLIELTGRSGDPERIVSRLRALPSGSIMCAPSSTAFAMERAGRVEAPLLSYLRSTMNTDGGQRHFGPYEIMEGCYSLYALRRSGVLRTQAAHGALRRLREAWTAEGVAFSREFPAVDLDDSALTALVVAEGGEAVSPAFLDAYAGEDYFRCYLSDRRGAVAPNLHAIEALRVLAHPRKEALTEVALRYVRANVRGDGSFLDHYSVSPNYPTWHAIEALSGVDERLAERAALFLAASQRADGSWAPQVHGPSTAEDTAYAVLGLCAWGEGHPGEFTDELAAGSAWLFAHRGEEPLPTWTAKVLYSPVTMAAAAVAGALSAAALALEGAPPSLSPNQASLDLPSGRGAPALQVGASLGAVSQRNPRGV
ncbi:MAG TPA: hypothetical protein VJ547_09940 [Candidatus Thermoplasmatota archaeon]|nr:hypothetical protein [Candidatus Thermoplasmatota archaeon]